MVVFEDGLPKKSDYRRVHDQVDDGARTTSAMMGEVIRRRFARVAADRDDKREDDKNKRFAYPPNLVVIDGGKGQLNRAVEVMDELGIDDLTVVSLAKRMEEVFLPDRPDPIVIPTRLGSPVPAAADPGRGAPVRDHLSPPPSGEADDAIGPRWDPRPRRGAAQDAAAHFGSVKKIREASLDEIAAVKGLPSAVAERVYKALHGDGAADRPPRRVLKRHDIQSQPAPACLGSRRHGHPGLSGAGRSEAAKVLEDLGFFVMDNLPPTLIKTMM